MAESHDVPISSTPFSSAETVESDDGLLTQENPGKLKSSE